MDEKVPFTEEAVKEYLNKNIRFWRKKMHTTRNDEEYNSALCYIDAYQSVRTSLFGETLPMDVQ